MKKSLVLISAIAALCAGSSAYASQNVANTSQKGSLLIWPLINVEGSHGTVVEITNDSNQPVHVECEYVNESKGRINFDFELTGKATASWDVGAHAGDGMTPAVFPTYAGTPAFAGVSNPYRGELVCFSTNRNRTFQIAWNELTGTATVIRQVSEVDQSRQAFKYNAWSFAARCDATVTNCRRNLAPDNGGAPQGTPGQLSLSGNNVAGEYDACPAYNTATFMPNGASLGSLKTDDNWLSVSGCLQDLRETYDIHATKLDFTVWNSSENSFTGAYACVDSVSSVGLGTNTTGSDGSNQVVNASNFDFSTLQTPNARFQVSGGSHTPPCAFPTEAVGLLGVVHSGVSINGGYGDQETGNTTQTAGIEAASSAGMVWWDVAGSTPATSQSH